MPRNTSRAVHSRARSHRCVTADRYVALEMRASRVVELEARIGGGGGSGSPGAGRSGSGKGGSGTSPGVSPGRGDGSGSGMSGSGRGGSSSGGTIPGRSGDGGTGFGAAAAQGRDFCIGSASEFRPCASRGPATHVVRHGSISRDRPGDWSRPTPFRSAEGRARHLGRRRIGHRNRVPNCSFAAQNSGKWIIIRGNHAARPQISMRRWRLTQAVRTSGIGYAAPCVLVARSGARIESRRGSCARRPDRRDEA